jgi:molybdopterin converting factor subunit 1
MQLTVRYFAILREQAGESEETLETSAVTPAELYEEIAASRGFTLGQDLLKVSVNESFVTMDHVLKDGDAVVFIPPVAGG